MWIEFFITVFLVFVLLYIPGFFFFKAIKFNALNSLIFAPIYSISIYCILGIVYCWFNLPANCSSLFFPALGLGVFVFLVSCLSGKQKLKLEFSNYRMHDFIRSDWAVAGLYVLVALVISYFYYINTLDGSYSFAQDSDNSWHLSLIQSFIQFKNMSVLDTSLYHDLNLAGYETLMPSSGSFYPAAWHILAAMGAQLTSVSVSLSANAVNFVIIAVVIPLCEFAIIRRLFENRLIHISGAFISLGFIAYPWGMILASSGPLFPNLLGFAIVPALFAGTISMLKGEKIGPSASLVITLCLGAIAAAASHPNALFTLLIWVIPFLTACLMDRVSSDKPNKKIKCILLISVVTCLSLIGWYFVHELPFFQSTVNYNWISFASFRQELVNIFSLGFRLPVTQLVLGIVLLIGILYLLFKKQARWLLVSYVICCVFCFVGATSDGWLKSYLTGFWYTDPYRLGAMAALMAIPIAAVGLYALFRTIHLVVEKLFDQLDRVRRKRLNIICSTCLAIVLIVLNYYPNFSLKGVADIETAFGYYESWNIYANLQNRPNLYSSEESQFVEKVSNIVDPDYSIYNCGDDGSPFAYAFENLNLCYRRSAATLLDGGETRQSELLRNKINELSYNVDVQNAIREANIKYVLVLDMGGQATAERCYYGYYAPSKWPGINAIDDETPGLKCLLAEGDMRLYEIEFLD